MKMRTFENFVAAGMAAQKAISAATGQNVLMVRRKWGAHPPEWVLALAEECDRTSQGRAASRLGIKSASIVNQALQNKYAGRMDRLEERVRGELMNKVLACPVLGEISARRCLDEQARPFTSSNALRLRLNRACATCANRREP
jgi:hypothetical protein